MPIYEYRCDKGHTFEVMQRMTDDPVMSCQTCEAPVQRVFHPVAVHFKGSGFYNTDYGTRKRGREKGEAGEGASGSDSKVSGDSDSKTKSRSDSKASTATASD
jgi:putative FmdB family regulatory protein